MARRDKENKPETYCTDCINRLDGNMARPVTNQSPFCDAGYQQNPRSLEATVNALRAGAVLCEYNPHRSKALMIVRA